MSLRFHAEPATKSLCTELSTLAPVNPFYTWPYIEARRSLGSKAWILTLSDDNQIVTGCSAFMTEGLRSRSLEIASLPKGSFEPSFWSGLFKFCQHSCLSYLEINTYASELASIPAAPYDISRVRRWEHVIDLMGPDIWEQIHQHHKVKIKKAQKTHVQVRRTHDSNACQEHASLMMESMKRRSDRGEVVPSRIDADYAVALVKHGAGELFQAVLQDQIVSSMLILKADHGAYLQSSGNAKEGMACGASHFLVYEIARALLDSSALVFNLGGTDKLDSGLAEYKSRFGTSQIPLESATALFQRGFGARIANAARFTLNQIRTADFTRGTALTASGGDSDGNPNLYHY